MIQHPAIQERDLANRPSILVGVLHRHRHLLPEDQRTRELLGSLAEGLALLGTVNPMQADLLAISSLDVRGRQVAWVKRMSLEQQSAFGRAELRWAL